MKKIWLVLAVLLGVTTAGAFSEIPRESAKALRVTKGRKFSEGLVFVNGKFVPPPYCVERWGTGIRINKVPVTGQVIDWAEFLKTQPGYRPEASAAAPASALPVPAPVSASSAPVPAPSASVSSPSASVSAAQAAEDYSDATLDDLFDDNPPPKPKETAPAPVVAAPPPEAKPVPAWEGPFVKNDAAKALIKQVNAARLEIDRTLRSGGFICFGDNYARIVGDSRAAAKLLEALPEIQKKAETVADFRAAVRAAKLVYLHELVCDDLFRNRIDYRRLLEHRQKLQKEEEWKKMMEAPKPLF